MQAKDPYRYFRIEAQELLEGLTQGLLELEKAPDRELVQRLLRQAHTFKGASRVVKRGDIGELAQGMEEVLAPHREEGGPVDRATIDSALELLDRIRPLLAGLGSAPGPVAPAAPGDALEPDRQTVRIAVRDLDLLLEAALGARAAVSSLEREGESLRVLCDEARGWRPGPRSAGRQAGSAAAELERLAQSLDGMERRIRDRVSGILGELEEVRAGAAELRLVPLQALAGDLARAARDAARVLDKEVALSFSGADTRIDAQVLERLRGALLHLVRNGVAHGIETRAERQRAGKPPTGRIDIAMERRGHRVCVRCSDDGGGLDLPSLRSAVVERGLADAEAARHMDDEALGRMLLQGGVSTSPVVTGIAGRGIGLDAVRDAVEALHGEIGMHSTAGQGTTVELLVPVLLSGMPALSLRLGGETVFLPLDSVRRALRVTRDDISHDAEGERVVVDGTVMAYLPLRRALGRPRHQELPTLGAVVLEADGRQAAVGADAVGATRDIVMRGIPRHAAVQAVVAGAALNDVGMPQLVLAPRALVRAAWDGAPVEPEPTAPAPPSILIVDDSLTTRMLEQSILESAGYRVDVAISGEDALAKAGRGRYGLWVVDIEMPGMDGFELIETMRGQQELRDTPIILVTSRADPGDKRRGKELGAHAYIVKNEFDQATLLDAIRRLVG